MGAAQCSISAGVCGFVTEVTALSEDGQHVALDLTSTCDKIAALGGAMPTVDAFAEISAGFDGELWATLRPAFRGCCAGCVVPAGIFKAMQVAAGLALSQSATVSVERIAG